MKKGDKIRFIGDEFDYSGTTAGKEYEIVEVLAEKVRYLGDNGDRYVWFFKRYPEDFILVPAEKLEPKVGDMVRFNGYEEGRPSRFLTIGKEYEIIRKDFAASEYVVIRDDNGKEQVWSYSLDVVKDWFTLVPAQDTAVPTPAERDLNTLQKGDIIKFMGVPEGEFGQYRDTTVGKEYVIYQVVHDNDGDVARVRYRDDKGDAISWRPNLYNHMYFFKVMTEQSMYKDDILTTSPTIPDLQSLMDLALLTNDIAWAQELYDQIQQLEGEAV